MTKKPNKMELLAQKSSKLFADAKQRHEAAAEQPAPRAQASGAVDAGDLDGRTLRATHRTHQFATRIKLETHKKMKRIAARDGITLGELIEKAVDAYEKESR
jgi:hypothetical protein